MKDIDFDELDKAVNSLMGAGVTTKPLQVTTPSATAEPSVQLDTARTPVDDIPDSGSDVSKSSVNTFAASPRPPAAPAKRRGGRFMDMVHTSSDMTPRSSAPVSRQGITIAPRPAPTETEAAPEPEVSDVSAESMTTQSGAQSVSWPDPIEMTDNKLQETPQTDTQGQPIPDVPEPPLESPFLSDAKVEKRPLNSGTQQSPNTVTQRDETVSEELDGERVIPAEDTPRPLVPAELKSDLVAIESSDPQPASTEAALAETAGTDAAAPETVRATAPPTQGPSSIAQQYREQPSTGDESHAAIYDTSQFVAPLAHPAKKKAGWLWIVWVILLLAVGAGGAVALYMADLI